MSQIQQMQIMGVRSFGPKNETIKFHTPLTLIVGWNGSGKTTIIECLKYATTGELPPNSKTGGAFIHDPTLRGEKDMMAQVKLAFRSTSGAAMVVTRSLQVTVKKTTRTQKTLEGCLEMKKDGVRNTISSRVAELDQILPQYLGVSKAILENVIFCHQDDSLWPMGEPANLKKKFDSIFEAEKYTKAIENIKVIRKQQVSELAIYRVNEEHAKSNRARGNESERKQAVLWDQMEDMRVEFEEIEVQWKEAQEKSTKAFDNAARFEQIIAQLNGKRVAYEANRENVSSLEDNLKVMAESDQELETMLEKYAERVKQYEDKQEEHKIQYRTLQGELQDNRRALGAKQGEVGKHEAEKDQHARNIQKREDLIKETAKRHKIRGYEYDVQDAQIAEFQQILQKQSREQDKSLDRARKDLQDNLQEAQAELSRFGEEKSSLTSQKNMAKTQITTNDRRISDLQNQMNKIKADEGAEAILQTKKNETEQQLKQANASADEARLDDRIEEVEKTVQSVDEKKERLETELVEATKSASESAQVDYAQNKLKGTCHSLETMKSVHSTRISQLLDPDWDAATLEHTFQQVVAQKASKVKEIESRRDIAQSKLGIITDRLSSTESAMKKKRGEFQKYEKTVLDAIQKDDIDDFDETLRELEETYGLSSSDQAKIEAQMEYMKACLQVAQEHNQCRLCKRTLKDDKADHFTKAGFISNLEGLVAKAMKNAGAENTDELFAELETVRNAKLSHESAIRARTTELPALQTEQEELTKQRDTINKQLEDLDNTISDLQSAKQEVESLSADVQSIVRYHNDVKELEAQISDLKKKQKAGGLSRGINAVRDDLQKITEQSRNAKTSLASLTGERDKSRKLINSLELRTRDINADLNSAQASLREKRSLAERIEEFRTSNNSERDTIRSVDEGIKALGPKIDQAQFKYDDINRRGNESVQRFHEEASKLSDSVRQLNSQAQEINAYIDKGGPQLLALAQKEMQQLQAEIQKIEEDMANVARDVKQIEQQASNTEQTKQSIFDNLRYRRAKRALETLDKEISDLEAKNAEKDQAHWNSEGQHWNMEHHKLNAAKVALSTTLKEKDIQLADLGKEYEQEYKNAAQIYREMHIKVETTKAAVEDLGRYGAALDQAVMKYHSIKMEEINKIVDELWRNAYQGTDVDSVQIRSDNETGRGNRAYNYRVVMFKSGSPMDMRGRCSAGQKVLASIIIRLALAECFGTNCGLIALDEPTTNLDNQNIKGLAESLSQIIQARKKQKNFQLLVITHDEQFLREMNCADYTDVYWRVGRDKDQESCIERQNISEVCIFSLSVLRVKKGRSRIWVLILNLDDIIRPNIYCGNKKESI
jgi:DNA repair protein RAD50